MELIQVKIKSNDLYVLLKDYSTTAQKPLDSNFVLELDLPKGNYIISNRIELKCSVIIRGNGSIITTSNFGDDCAFAVTGDGTSEIQLEVYDTTFKAGTTLTQDRNYIQAKNVNRVIFNNCSFNLTNNGTLSCVDLCRCSTIEITGSYFYNYCENFKANILRIQGAVNNVYIYYNQFYKHGNGSVISVYGDGGSSSSPVNKNNICIVKNQFFYEENDSKENDSEKYAIDKLLSFYDSRTRPITVISPSSGTTTSQIVDTRTFNWGNILISDNIFEIKDLVYNLIHFNFAAKNTSVKSLNISGNNIEHSGYTVETGEFERDFALLSQSDYEIEATIKENIITANHTVYSDSEKYIHLHIDGIKVSYVENNINATGMLGQTNSSGVALNTVGVIVSEIIGKGGRLTMCENEVNGSFMSVRSSYGPSSTTTIGDVELQMVNNILRGDTRIFCRKLDKMTAHFYGNRFVPDVYYLLFQDFGTVGSFYACDNTWRKSDINTYQSGNLCSLSNADNFTFDEVLFAGNVFFYYPNSIINSLPIANSQNIDGNVFIQK